MKQYDLEERTFEFARRVRAFVKQLPKNLVTLQDIPQLVRSSGSVGANYIEANESFSKKDFVMRAKICRKEAKEARYWLLLLDVTESRAAEEQKILVQEATELMNIFGSIIRKSS